MIATHDDIPRLIEMGRRFHAASGLAMGFDPQAVEGFLTGLIERGAVFATARGAIGGMAISPYCDPQWKIAVELFWWAEGDGLRLLRAFEGWAREIGADEVRMTSLAALPRADRLLRFVGYAPAEISYTRAV